MNNDTFRLERGIMRIINSTELGMASESPSPEMNNPLLSEYFLGEGLLCRVEHEFRTARQRLDAFSREAAIARTTQMLAHDVRKPFSSLEMGLNLVKSAKSTKEMQEMADITIGAVQKAMITVNGLIDDVMEIGRASAPTPSPIAVESLVETAILELFQVHENSKINLDLRLNHSNHLVLSIEELKVLRVFSNILGNGVQAMKKTGHSPHRHHRDNCRRTILHRGNAW